MTRADLPAAAAIESAAPHGWPMAQLEAELVLPQSRAYVALHAHAVVAHLVVWWVAGELHIMTLATHPGHRRAGHARGLLQWALKEGTREGACHQALLEVRAGNAAACALYRSLGFDEVGRRRRYYRDGEDAVLMTAKLGLPPSDVDA